jgi:hypothetical protein
MPLLRHLLRPPMPWPEAGPAIERGRAAERKRRRGGGGGGGGEA